jgi:hypothetical protein
MFGMKLRFLRGVRAVFQRVLTMGAEQMKNLRWPLVILAVLCSSLGWIVQADAAGRDTLWIETWEGDWGSRWSTGSGTWQVGAPTSGPAGAHESLSCAATVLDGYYSDGVSHRLVRFADFEVPGASEHPRLRFWHWYAFSSNDVGRVQLRLEGETEWTTISPPYTGVGGWV